MTRLFQQNVSFSSEELDIRSSRLLPIITYPHYSEREYKVRIMEMESLGVTSIILGDGNAIVNNTRVAGKGCVGIVVKARLGKDKVCALKIRRTDADRQTMDSEAYFHRIANSAGVGPSLKEHTKNLITMEYVTGENIIDWITGNNNNNKDNRNNLQAIVTSILEQCFSLDLVGLDHGELSRMARHVIVSDNRPYIVDFESASTTRKVCNVTASAQSLFLYGLVADRVRKILGSNIDREEVIQSLKTYKHSHTRAHFDAVLDVLIG